MNPRRFAAQKREHTGAAEAALAVENTDARQVEHFLSEEMDSTAEIDVLEEEEESGVETPERPKEFRAHQEAGSHKPIHLHCILVSYGLGPLCVVLLPGIGAQAFF